MLDDGDYFGLCIYDPSFYMNGGISFLYNQLLCINGRLANDSST